LDLLSNEWDNDAFKPGPPVCRGAELHMRQQWTAKRYADPIRTQMHYARKGMVTEEMAYVANLEKLTGEFVRDEVARGRMIIRPISST
jgi:hypothetical protein